MLRGENRPTITVQYRVTSTLPGLNEIQLLLRTKMLHNRGAFDSAKNHKRQRRKRQSVTAKREKSQTPKFV